MISIKIVTPTKIAFDGQCKQIFAPGSEGEFGVLEDHAQFLSLSKPGVVGLEGVQQDSGSAKDLEFFVGAGFVEVSDNSATLLVDSCCDRADISLENAEQELTAAQAELDGLEITDAAFGSANARAILAQAKVDAAS